MKTGFRKRAMSIVLSATMLIAILCIAPATAAAETTDDGLTYTVANEEVTITGYTGAGGAVVIPAEIDGKPVVALDQYAFRAGDKYNCPQAANITSIVVPDSVKSIGSNCFNGCGIETISLPEACIFGSTAGAFRNCSNLKSVRIPSGLTAIGNFFFENCTSLEEVTFAEPNTITSTGNSAFSNCTSLKEIVFPDGMTTIGSSFGGCTALADVTIPATVTSIAVSLDTCNPDNMTIHCYKDSYAQTWAVEKGLKVNVLDAGDELIYDVLNAKIAAAETALGDNAAYYTKDSLAVLRTELESAKNVKDTAAEQTQIDDAAAALDAKIKALVPFAFKYTVNENNEVTITGFNDDKSEIITPSMDVVIPGTIDGMPVTEIAAGVFENRLIKTLSLPASVKTIGENAFKSCPVLTSVTFEGDGLVTIGDNAFNGAQKLAKITLPETLESIGMQAFSGARVLKSLTIPASVKTIGDYAISNCFELADVFVLNKDVAYGEGVFKYSKIVTLHAESGSTTETYAAENDIPFVSTTKVNYNYYLGDVDGNEEVNIADVLKIQNWLGKKIELDKHALLAADIDENVKVELADVLNIQKYLALMAVDYPFGEQLTIAEEDIPDYPAPEVPTQPSSESTVPTEGSSEGTQPAPAGQMTLYVSNAVSWVANDGCKLWAYNVDTQEFVLMDINEDRTFFSATVADTWQNIEFYRTTFDIDENTISTDLPIEQLPNKWTSLPARGDKDCFLVTADSAGEWHYYEDLKPSEDAKTVYFDNSKTQWDTVYVYGWSYGLANEFVEMEKVSDTIYKYTFSIAPTPGAKGFLFVDAPAWGGQQTEDCAVEAGKNLFKPDTFGTKWNGTWDVYEP